MSQMSLLKHGKGRERRIRRRGGGWCSKICCSGSGEGGNNRKREERRGEGLCKLRIPNVYFTIRINIFPLFSFSPSFFLCTTAEAVYTTTNSAPLRFFYGNAPPLFIPNRSCWPACLDVLGWLAAGLGLEIEHSPPRILVVILLISEGNQWLLLRRTANNSLTFKVYPTLT